MKSLLLSIFGVLLVITSQAQSPPGPFLTSADIDRFINSGLEMIAELEDLGDDMYNEENEEETYDELLASYNAAIQNKEALETIRKYGWSAELFGEKIMSIVMGTTNLIAEKQLQQMAPEQRAMMEEMITLQFQTIVHPDDLKLLKPRLSELEIIFSQIE